MIALSIFDTAGDLGNAPNDTLVYVPFGDNSIPGFVPAWQSGGGSIGGTGGYGPSPFIEQPLTAVAPVIAAIKTPSSLAIDDANDGNTSIQTMGTANDENGFDTKTVLIGIGVIAAALWLLKGK